MERRFKEGQYGAKFKWWQEPGFEEYVEEIQQQEPPTPGPDFATRMFYDPKLKEIVTEQTSFPLFYNVANRGLTVERTRIPAVQSVMAHVARDFDPSIFEYELMVRARGMSPGLTRPIDWEDEAPGISADPTKYLTQTELAILSGQETYWGRMTSENIEAIQEALIDPELRRAHATAIVELEDVREDIAKMVVELEGKPSSIDEPRGLVDIGEGPLPLPYDERLWDLADKKKELEATIARFDSAEKIVEETIPDLPTFIEYPDGTVRPLNLDEGQGIQGFTPFASWFRSVRNVNADLQYNAPLYEAASRSFRLETQDIMRTIGKGLAPLIAWRAYDKYIKDEQVWETVDDEMFEYELRRSPSEFRKEMEARREAGLLSRWEIERLDAKTYLDFLNIENEEEDEAYERHLVEYDKSIDKAVDWLAEGGLLEPSGPSVWLSPEENKKLQEEADAKEQEWLAIPEELTQLIDEQIADQESFKTDFSRDEADLRTSTAERITKVEDLYRRGFELARGDTRFNDYTWRFEELIGPERLDDITYKELVIKALAVATLQKGRLLLPQEIERITEQFADPTSEFLGEIGFDFFNLCPLVVTEKLIVAPIKGLFKAPGIVLDIVSHLDDAAKLVDKIKVEKVIRKFTAARARAGVRWFKTACYASRGHQLVDKSMEFFANLGRTTSGMDDFQTTLGKFLTGEMGPGDLSKYRLSPRQLEHMMGKKGIWRLLGLERPDDLLNLVRSGYDDVFEKKVQELFSANAFSELAPVERRMMVYEKALAFASETDNVLSAITTNIQRKYMSDVAKVYPGGPVRDSMLGYLAEFFKFVDKPTARSLTRHYLNAVGRARHIWASSILTARPGFTVINFSDSTFRAAVHGGNLLDDLATIRKMVPYFPEDIPGGFMKAMTGELEDIGHLLTIGKAPESYREIFLLTAKQGKNPLDKFLHGMRGLNSAKETVLRMRVYAPTWLRNWAVIQGIIDSHLDEVGVLANALCREILEELKIIAPHHPDRIIDLMNTLLTGKIDPSRPGITAFFDRDTYKALAEVIGGPRARASLNPLAQAMADEVVGEAAGLTDDAVRRIMNEAREEILTAEKATFRRASEFIDADTGYDPIHRAIDSVGGNIMDDEPHHVLDELTKTQADDLAATKAAVHYEGTEEALEQMIEVPTREVGAKGRVIGEPFMEEISLGEAIDDLNSLKALEASDEFATLIIEERKYTLERIKDLNAALVKQEFIEIADGKIVSRISGAGIKEDMYVRMAPDQPFQAGTGRVVGFTDEGDALVIFAEGADPHTIPPGVLQEVSPEELEMAGLLREGSGYTVPAGQLDIDDALEFPGVSQAHPDIGANRGQLFLTDEGLRLYPSRVGKSIVKVADETTIGGEIAYKVVFSDGKSYNVQKKFIAAQMGVGDREVAAALRFEHISLVTNEALPEEAIRSMVMMPERAAIDPALSNEITDAARVLRGELPDYADRAARPDWHRNLTQGPKHLSGKLTVAEADEVLEECLKIIESGDPIPDILHVGKKQVSGKTLTRFVEGVADEPERFSLSSLLTERMTGGETASPYATYLMGATDEEVAVVLRARGYGKSVEEFLEGTGSELAVAQYKAEKAQEKIYNALVRDGVEPEYIPTDVRPRPVVEEAAINKRAGQWLADNVGDELTEEMQEPIGRFLKDEITEQELLEEIAERIPEQHRQAFLDEMIRPDGTMREVPFDPNITPEDIALDEKLMAEIQEAYETGVIAKLAEKAGIKRTPEGMAEFAGQIEASLARHKETGVQIANSTRKYKGAKSFLSDVILRQEEPAIAYVIEAYGWDVKEMSHALAYLEALDDIQSITTGKGMFEFLTKEYLYLGDDASSAAARHSRFETYYLIREHMGIWKSKIYDDAYDLVMAGKWGELAKKMENMPTPQQVLEAGGFTFLYDGETLKGIGNKFSHTYGSPIEFNIRGKMLSDLQVNLDAIGKTELQSPIWRSGTTIDPLYENHVIPRTPRPTLRSAVKHPEKIVMTEDPRLLERGLRYVDEYGSPVVDDEILDASWDAVKGKDRVNARKNKEGSLNRLYGASQAGVLDSPDSWFKYMDSQIKIAAKKGNTEKVKLLEFRKAQVMQDLNTMNAFYGVDTPRYLIPDEGMLPKGLRQFFAEGTATQNRTESVMKAYDEMEDFLLGTKKSRRGLDSVFARQHEIDGATEDLLIRLRDDLSQMQIEGIEVSNYGTGHLPENNWHGYRTTGAVAETNKAMLNYNEFTPADQFMKSIFPFWMFPSRSLPMWVETMGMHPEIATFYFKYMDLSERTMMQAGFITSDGRQLPSSRGYIRLPGTEGIAINVLSPLSFRYAIPDYDEYYDAFHHLSPWQKLGHRMINSLTMFGLNPSPIITSLAYGWNILDENIRPAWSVFPQTGLVPPNAQRFVIETLRRIGLPMEKDKWTPDVSWKDYLIEDLMRTNAYQQVQVTSDPEEQMRIVGAVESATRNKTSGSLEDAELWLSTREQFENSEYNRKLTGYMTGFYPKQFTDAQAEIILSRMNSNATAHAVNNLVGAEVMELDVEAEAMWEHYKLNRYETPEGHLHTLHNVCRYVRTEAGDPAYDEIRDEIIAMKIDQEQRNREYWEAVGELQEIRDNSIAELPEGATGAERSPIYDIYYEEFGKLDTQREFDPAMRPWFVGFKPARLVMEDIENVFFYTSMSALEPYDDEKEEYLDFKAREMEHIAIELPLLVQSSVPLWERYDKLQWLDPEINSVGAIGARLLEIANPEGYEDWRRKTASLDTALFRVYETRFVDEYYKAVDDKEHEEYDIAEMDFYNRWRDNPINKKDGVGPSEEHFLQWMEEDFGDREWTEAEILKAINPEVYDMEDRMFAQRAGKVGEDFAKAEDEVWDIHGSIPPGSHDEFRNEFKDALPPDLEGEGDRFLEALTNKDVEFVDAEAIEKFVPAMRIAQSILGLTSRDDLPREDLEERVQVRADNEAYHAFVNENTYPGFWEEYARYQDRSYAWQKDYRDTHPDFKDAMKELPALENQWALDHPIWAEYYSKGDKKVTATGGAGYGTAARAKTSTTARPALRDIRFGKRSTMDVSYLLKPGQLGRGGTSGRLVWPPKLKEAAGEDLIEEVEALKSDGTPLGPAAKTALQKLLEKFPRYKEFLAEIGMMDEIANREREGGIQEF